MQTPTPPQKIRAAMDAATAFTVCDALIYMGVNGSDAQGREAVQALHQLGFEGSAVALDWALAPRREANHGHSVQA